MIVRATGTLIRLLYPLIPLSTRYTTPLYVPAPFPSVWTVTISVCVSVVIVWCAPQGGSSQSQALFAEM